ncbi:hypothetical protein QO015_003700 [Kaistia geumhonensis]|uniref:Uncharacterized protein n=1 Tax=Kaistia geumhonensis TaxID=410839 RepID=A0ABU0MB05_9HYPH|nr:hypothetical protein [Kaistia geumhonensis]
MRLSVKGSRRRAPTGADREGGRTVWVPSGRVRGTEAARAGRAGRGTAE